MILQITDSIGIAVIFSRGSYERSLAFYHISLSKTFSLDYSKEVSQLEFIPFNREKVKMRVRNYRTAETS